MRECSCVRVCSEHSARVQLRAYTLRSQLPLCAESGDVGADFRRKRRASCEEGRPSRQTSDSRPAPRLTSAHLLVDTTQLTELNQLSEGKAQWTERRPKSERRVRLHELLPHVRGSPAGLCSPGPPPRPHIRRCT